MIIKDLYQKYYILAAVLFILQLPILLHAESQNVALGKACKFSPAPNYPLTTDEGDIYQLTDGKIEQSLWYESCRDKTVGWLGQGLIEIVIDLKSSAFVETIKVYTVGGGRAGAEYPEYVAVMISDDGTRYSLSSLADSSGYDFSVRGLAKPRVMQADIKDSCRFVKFLVRPTGNLFFTDEIEVLASNGKGKDKRTFLTNEEAINLIERQRQLKRNIATLRDTIRSEKYEVNDVIVGIDTFDRYLLTVDKFTDEYLSNIENGFNKIRSKYLASKFKSDWFYNISEPLDILRYETLPEKKDESTTLYFYQWQNEHCIRTFNLVNCTDAVATFKISASPLNGGGKYIASDNFLEVRRAVYIVSKNTGYFADPLVLQGNKSFPVKPGETVQIWVDFYSKGLSSGNYIAALSVTATGDSISTPNKTIPIEIEVTDKVFPKKVEFKSCSWDYLIADKTIFTSNNYNPQDAIKDLNSHYINVTCIPPRVIYNYTSAPKSLKYGGSKLLNNELKLREKFYKLVFLAIEGYKSKFGEFRTHEWELNFKFFLGQLVNTMHENGCDYNDFAIYPFDEYIGDDYIYVAKIIREFDPKLKIFANCYGQGPKDFRKVFGLVDIWCLPMELSLKNPAWLEELKKVSDKVWCYGGAPKELYVARTEIYYQANYKGFYRLEPIKAIALGMTGAGFWVYTDWKGGHWNDTIQSYGVVYDGREAPEDCILETIVPSTRWQLWREGIEDAVCLSGHKDLLDELMRQSDKTITSDYIMELRKRADKVQKQNNTTN
jgi:hypothetical protein